MNPNKTYRTITREQFLFHEMRIVAKFLQEGMSDSEIIQKIYDENLFQYPTESMIKNITKVCLSRFHEAESQEVTEIVASGSSDSAKQACLFLMMNFYRLVWDFMITVIGEKYRNKDTSLTKMDFNSFFTRLQEQNDVVASWSDATIYKCKQVIKKTLIENQYLDNKKSETLNNVLIDFELKEAIKNVDSKALIAFNCFE